MRAVTSPFGGAFAQSIELYGGPGCFPPQLLVSIAVFFRIDAAIQHENGARLFPGGINRFRQYQNLSHHHQLFQIISEQRLIFR
jgi:hypothetical protein